MNNAKIYLQEPDWGTIRRIYQKLSKEFHILTSAYRIELNEDTLLMMDHLIVAIDEVDQCRLSKSHGTSTPV